MYGAKHEGVYFVEGKAQGFQPIQTISTELNEFFSQNQLKSLADIKSRMASQALQAGGNVICNFRYGQRSSFWKSIFGMDNVLWYASGVIGRADKVYLEATFR
jgi:hypothetical protein